jgi:hypothetical protein
VIQQWTSAQVHDTVAAIVSQPEFASAKRQSLLSRAFRWLVERIADLLDWTRGSFDARWIVGLAIAIVAFIVIARIVVDRRLEAARRRGFTARGPRGDRQDLRALALQLAGEGRYADASHALYGALLYALTSAGLVRYHASKTTGDYARELRRGRSPLAEPVREFGRGFDRAVYGDTSVTREQWDALLAAAESIEHSIRPRAAA